MSRTYKGLREKYKDRFPIATTLHEVLHNKRVSHQACDNIIDAMKNIKITDNPVEGVRDCLREELEDAFEGVLYCLGIDIVEDANSIGTPKRLAKMYLDELLKGRTYEGPSITTFPNVKSPLIGNAAPSKAHEGNVFHLNNLLVVKAPFISMCSHHLQPVKGCAYIGIIPGKRLMGLSKYTRLVRHLAERGTLQEELTLSIVEELSKVSQSDNIGVVVYASHGCCENRGIQVHDSTTTTAEMRGLFMSNKSLREELYANIANMRKEG